MYFFDLIYNLCMSIEFLFFKYIITDEVIKKLSMSLKSQIILIFYAISQILCVFNIKFLVVLLLAVVSFSKISLFLKSLLTNERSKKIYFLTYVISITAILLQCLFLLSSDVSDVSDQGILLLYVYITATLMLFLIYLALTTCESVFDKEKLELDSKTKNIKHDFKNFDLFILSKTFQIISIYWIYQIIMWEILQEYQLRVSIFKIIKSTKVKSIPKLENIDTLKYSINEYREPFNNHNKFTNDVSKSKNSIWGVFYYLKFGILDTASMYFLSAILQACTLIIVIITVIV